MTTIKERRRKKAIKKLIVIAIIGVILIIIAVIGKTFSAKGTNNKIDELNAQISALEAQNQELTVQKDEMQAELTEAQAELSNMQQAGAADQNAFISAIFWSNGNFYKDTSGIEFYSEPSCENSLGNDLKFVSPVIFYDMELKNGQKVNVTLSEKGLVYSVQKPNLDVYEEE